ncbi:MAG: BON domain-containing protein [Pirellulales bacterium]|nr:BON domain-containing protein [Pirellulales bacterium]
MSMIHHVCHDAEPLEARDLERRVRLFLASAKRPSLRRIKVELVGDAVVLSGCVQTFYEKQLATEFAKRVAGVVSVVNRLAVWPCPLM